MKDKIKTTQKQYIIPFVCAFIVTSTIWALFKGVDWFYLLFTICAILLFTYINSREIKQIKQLKAYKLEQERIKTEHRIKHMANYDDFTGLPNRRLFFEQLAEALVDAKKNKSHLSVLVIDIDRFKLVNESLGHDYGDILLMQIAERLTRIVKKKDFIARMEGDEFALYFPDLRQQDEATTIAQSIMNVIEPVFLLQEYQLQITISIGMSFHLDEDDDANTLMKYANMALSRAKELGRNNFQYYTPAMNIRSFERLTLENDLRRAIEDQEFIVYYQPQINTETGDLVGAEALIRWNHPTKGMVMPAEFIPLAEENGMIVPIGDWVLYKACEQNKAWQEAGYPPFPISVNLSIRQFLRQDLVGKIADILAKTNLEAQYLELEITESMTMDVEHAINSLHELRALGVSISIDDFGTGYSSLSYLKKFPINKLKIDRTFVRDIMRDPNDASIVTTIIAMAHGLDLKVIAEGVETAEQFKYLRENHCNEVQGYLFSPPIAAEGLMQKIKLLN